MPRKSIPAHLRKSGPGTGGRNWERDLAIYAEKKATGASNKALGKKHGLNGGTIGSILRQCERNAAAGRTRWMSTAERRAEFLKELTDTRRDDHTS